MATAVAATALHDDALQPRGAGVGGLEPFCALPPPALPLLLPALTRCTVVRDGCIGDPQARPATPLLAVTGAEAVEAVADTPPELPPTVEAFEADVHSVSPRGDGAKDIVAVASGEE